MTWFAQAEGTEASCHDTEAEALVAADGMRKPVVVWEADEGEL